MELEGWNENNHLMFWKIRQFVEYIQFVESELNKI